MELPGPETHQVWLIGWRVFSTACVMLKAFSSAALEAYECRIERLVRLWPDAWHLIATSDEQMRAEQLESIRRTIATSMRMGHPSPGPANRGSGAPQITTNPQPPPRLRQPQAREDPM